MSNPTYELLRNVHLSLEPPSEGETYLTKEDYYYHHYKCDGFNDVVGSWSFLKVGIIKQSL